MGFRRFRHIVTAGCLAILTTAAFGQSAPAKAAEGGARVTLDGDTLFRVHANLGPFSAAERAAATSARLLALAKDLTSPIDAIALAPSDASTDIVARDRVLLSISDADAKAARTSRSELAAAYVQNIRSAVSQRRAQYSYRSIIVGASMQRWQLSFSSCCSGAFGGFTRSSLERSRQVEALPFARFGFNMPSLFRRIRITGILLGCLRFIRACFVLTLCRVYIPLVMSFFPWTANTRPLFLDILSIPYELPLSHSLHTFQNCS